MVKNAGFGSKLRSSGMIILVTLVIAGCSSARAAYEARAKPLMESLEKLNALTETGLTVGQYQERSAN